MNTKTKTILLFFGTLVIGILIGIVGDSLFRSEREQEFWQSPPQERIRSILKKELDLNDQQQARIDSILASHFPPPGAMQIMSDPTLMMFRRLEEEITPVLNEAQKTKFIKRLATMSENSIAMRVAMLKDFLQLTEKQQQQLTQLFSEREKQIKQRRGRFYSLLDSLPPGFGEGRIPFFSDSLRPPRGMAFLDSTGRQIELILSPEQLRKFQMRPQRFGE